MVAQALDDDIAVDGIDLDSEAAPQPVTFTSEWFKTRQLPAGWDDQRQIVSGL